MAATRRLTVLEDNALEAIVLPQGPVVVALSGGADSATLAHLCLRAGSEVELIHVDHGLAHSERLANAAEEIAASLGLELQRTRVTVGGGPSLEDQARQARYDVLCAVDGTVLTGHTMNDSVETMLINLVRGTGLDGLTGVPYHRPPNVYRPLLGVTRSLTREIAGLASLPYLDDPTNRDVSILRNRMRLDLIPRMEELNPNLVESMARTAQLLGLDRTFLDDLTAMHDPGGPIPVGLLATLPKPIADRVLRTRIVDGGGEADASAMERAWSVIRGDSPSQQLNRGLVARVESGILLIGPPI